jgi:hypothetical protein
MIYIRFWSDYPSQFSYFILPDALECIGLRPYSLCICLLFPIDKKHSFTLPYLSKLSIYNEKGATTLLVSIKYF